MNNYDNIILKLFYTNKGINKKNYNRINDFQNIKNYLENRFDDSDSIIETLKRIKLKIEIKPKCPICGKPVKFIGKNSKMFSKYCSLSCKGKDPKIYLKSLEGQKKYYLENFGVEYNYQRKDFIEKRKEKLIEKFGTLSLSHVPEIYEKIKNTCINKYGEITPMLNKDIQIKRNISMKENNSFNKSNQEELCFYLLSLIYSDIIRQYSDDRYPFQCDFYIPSIDLFIEYNGSWTHNDHIFDKDNVDDLKKVELWKSKNTDYYNI